MINVFDRSISNFASYEILERETEEQFLNRIGKLDQNDDCYEESKNSIKLQKKKELDAVFSMRKLRQKKHENIQ